MPATAVSTAAPLPSSPSLPFRLSGQGPHTVVCIHELGGSMDSFLPLLTGLERHCRVLRYDQRGQGLAAVSGGDYAMAQQADDLATVLAVAGLQGPYWLLGIAAGAAIAVTYTAHHAADVAGLMLCSPALSMAGDRAANLLRRADQAVAEGMLTIVDDTLARSWPPRLREGAELASRFDAYRQRLIAANPQGYAAANRALANYVATPDLAQVHCPVTLVAGLFDQVRPPEVVSALRAQLPDARYVEILGAHLLPQQAPLALLTEIDVALSLA
jgi:3-oxoadipate enol-lactonase